MLPALVDTPTCFACGSPVGDPHEHTQEPLFAHGGFGAATLTRWVACPICGTSDVVAVESVRPRRRGRH